MKYLLLHPQPYLYSFGGLCVAQRAMMEGLVELGHECLVVTVASDSACHAAKPLAQPVSNKEHVDGRVVERRGVTIVELGSEDTTHSVPAMARLIDEYMKERDFDFVCVAEDFLNGMPPRLGSWLEAAALVVPDERLIYLCHSAGSLPFGAESFDVTGEGAHRQPIFARCAGIITVSEHLRGYLQKQAGLDATVIPMPVYGAGPFAALGRFGAGKVGIINPSEIKGLPIFIGVARSLPHIEFAAVPTWATGEAEIAKLRDVPNISILDPIRDRDALYGQFSVLMVPSLWQEPWGLVVVEAMLRGVPVVASRLGGIVEAKLGVDYLLPVRAITAYEKSDTMFPRAIIPDQDLSPWVETIERLYRDRDDYERVSRESATQALRFAESLGISRFVDYFDSLRAQRQAGAPS